MAFGSLSFSYVLKMWRVFVRWSTFCPQNAARHMQNEDEKKKDEKGRLPCLQLLYIALNTLARHLSSGLVLLGKGRSFIKSHTPGEGALFQQLWGEGCKPLSLHSLPSQLVRTRPCNSSTSGGEINVWWWQAFLVLCFLPNFPSTTFQHVCLNAAIRGKIHLPCRIGHNKCLWKKIFSRTFTVFSSFSQKAAHYLITYCVPLSLQNCSHVAITQELQAPAHYLHSVWPVACHHRSCSGWFWFWL